MRVGDRVRIEPDFMRNAQEGVTRVTATVVYIHPQRRYFTAEFVGANGDKIRESFALAHRGGK